MTSFEGIDLACVRGERLVFAGLGFQVDPGEALVLVGANGSGKSSLLRLMAGLIGPASGRMLWGGVPTTDDPEAHRERLGYLGHLDAVKPSLSVRENLAFWASLAGAGAGSTMAALEAFGLDRLADLPGRYLSQGQRRRLALARVAATTPELWLLDEPSVGLDRASLAALAGVIQRHRQGGGRVVVATHAELELGLTRTLDLDRFRRMGTA